MGTAVILSWDSVASVVNVFSERICLGLQGLGINAKIVNVMDHDLNVKPEALAQCLTDPEVLNCDIAISIGGPPLSIRVGALRLFDIFGKLFYLYSLDALMYDYLRVDGVAEFIDRSKVSPRLRVMSPDRDACRVVNSFTAYSHCPYVPFGGFFQPLIPRERIRRIAVIANQGVHFLMPVPESASFEEVAFQAPPSIMDNPRLGDFVKAIERPGPIDGIPNLALDVLGIPGDRLFTPDIAAYLATLDTYQKRKRRERVITALWDMPVDIFGSGWEPFASDFRDCRLKGPISHFQIEDLCQSYHTLLDFNPTWGHGLHDRVYTGVGSGCRVLTNACRAVDDLDLPSEDAVLTYEWNESSVRDVAEYALSLDPLDYASILAFRDANSWSARMDEFVLHANTY